MVQVLLISPPFRGLLREPLGLYYLAGVLRSNGISTALMDFNVELPTRSEFRRQLQRLSPRIVGVTSYTFNFSVAQKIINEIKRVKPSIVTVMGGVHASALPKEVLESTPALDFIVVGEGEYTFLEFCKRILAGESVDGVRGLAFRRGGKVVVNPPRELIRDLDELPVPDRDLLPFKKYPVATVQTSRGCPYNCIFCNINRFYGRRIRLRDPRRVAEECFTLVKRYGREKIFFFGDAFTFRSDWVEELCDEIHRKRLKFIWGCETRVDNVSLPLLRKMRKAGCVEIQYGIDYGDEEVLKNLGKDISIGEIDDAVRWAKEVGLFVGAFFIFNVPGEDEGTMENTFNLIQRVPVDAIEVNLLTPYPGTPLWTDPGAFDMRIIDYNFDYYTTKKYVMENLHFPKRRFVPAFKRLLKRLNLIPTPGYYPEIYDFLKRDIKPRAWREERRGLRRLLRL
ncbi:B12-binding domain-containing radical SAM protein [Candidatus Bathyarchaeota archaeon]|nr:B12-binding domain-containing radical SAM protein [Candidatus Bathyarchaeota archaeon]